MNLFHQIPDKFVMLVSKRGIYRQAKAYTREGRVYAGYGGGYVQLVNGGGTSCPDVTWFGSDVDMKAGRMGRMVLREKHEAPEDFRVVDYLEAAAA